MLMIAALAACTLKEGAAPSDVAAPPADAHRTPSGLASRVLRVGLGDKVGESPDIELDSADMPHIAFTTDGFELGYGVCTADCEDPDKAVWNADFAERSDAAATDRPTALPFTCDGEVWNGMEPSLALVEDRPIIAYGLSVEARCLYKEIGEPEITYEFHEIWRGSRVMRPAA